MASFLVLLQVLALFAMSMCGAEIPCKYNFECDVFAKQNCTDQGSAECHQNFCECKHGSNEHMHGHDEEIPCKYNLDCAGFAKSNCTDSTYVVCHDDFCECTLGPNGEKCLFEEDCHCPHKRHGHCINYECHCAADEHEH